MNLYLNDISSRNLVYCKKKKKNHGKKLIFMVVTILFMHYIYFEHSSLYQLHCI